MVQHDLAASKRPLFILILVLVTSSANSHSLLSRPPRSLFGSLFGAVVSTLRNHHHHVKTSQSREADAITSRLDPIEAVIHEENSIQNTNNQTNLLFGPIFSNVTSSTTTTTEVTPIVNQSPINETMKPKGVFDDIANGISSLFGGAGPAVDSGPVNLVPNNCWYRGEQYECALSITCAVQGRKSLDLCNGGLIWTCCVDREKIDKVDNNLGALSDAKCGEIYTGETGRALSDRQSRIVGGHNTFFGQHPWQVLKTNKKKITLKGHYAFYGVVF